VYDRLIRHDDRPGIICWHEAETPDGKPPPGPEGEEWALTILGTAGPLPMTAALSRLRERGFSKDDAAAVKDTLLADNRLTTYRPPNERNPPTYIGAPKAIAELKERTENPELNNEIPNDFPTN
jgi:hypothetical protein